MVNHHIRLESILPQKRLLVTRENVDLFLCRDKLYIYSKESDRTNTSSVASKLKLGKFEGYVISRNFKEKKKK
jgi:hypothetical protein